MKDLIPNEAISSLVNKLYDDVLSESAKELGDNVLKPVAECVSHLFKPLKLINFTVNEFYDFIEASIARKLVEKGISKDSLIEPDRYIFTQSILGLASSFEKKELREMFLNLLTNSMNSNSKDYIHPSYVSIINQLSVQDAVILESISNKVTDEELFFPSATVVAEHKNKKGGMVIIRNLSYYLAFFRNTKYEKYDIIEKKYYYEIPSFNYILVTDNLLRLSIFIKNNTAKISTFDYNEFKNLPEVEKAMKNEILEDRVLKIKAHYIELSEFGRSFIKTCIL